MGSQDSSMEQAADEKFRFDFLSPHVAPPITGGRWRVEDDGISEVEVVGEKGKVIAYLGDDAGDDPALYSDAQCIALVPELVRGIYTAMRALRGAMPDNESPETVAEYLSELLKRCYASPGEGGTIKR